MTSSLSGLSKRKPGRPPKLRSDSGLGVQVQMSNVQPHNADVSPNQPQLQFQGNSKPLSASINMENESVAVPSPPPTENSSAPAKRGRGRPRKVGASSNHATVSGGGETQGIETRSGRYVTKPKIMSVPMVGNGGVVKRSRGRPRKPVTVPLSGNVRRPRGRPKRAQEPQAAVAENGSSGPPSAIDNEKLFRKPIGTPSKVGSGTAAIVTDPRQLVVYQELVTKYQLLQSKVKQVASVIKPCIEAIQELEALCGPSPAN